MSAESTLTENTKSTLAVGYSWQIGFVYVFNLIVGAGLLALPKAFDETGLLLGSICLGVLALMSYITVTFTIEAMAISNAFIRYKTEEKKRYVADAKTITSGQNGINDDCNVIVNSNILQNGNKVTMETTKSADYRSIQNAKQVKFECNGDTVVMAQKLPSPKTNMATDDCLYDITVNVELGEMSKIFFWKPGVILYYISVCLYLYGGLSIYAAAISKSLTTVVCGDAACFQGNDSTPCRNIQGISVHYMYRIMLAIFVLLICPFAYFRITNTKILQIFTTTYRWISMTAMVILACIKIGSEKREITTNMKLVNLEHLPNFFGVAIYSFMCQHSIPAVLTPVKNKNRIKCLVILDFISVIVFYATILFTAVFAYPQNEIQDLYTLNFTTPSFFRYLLQLFPVLTLSANFPILAIVLGDNLKTLILTNSDKDYGFFLNRIFFPTIVILPPIAVAYTTSNVGMLVGFTGTYAGAILQYVIPTMLVYCGRRKMMQVFGVYRNKHQSPFRHRFWVVMVMTWYVVCLVFVTYNKVRGK